MCVCVCVDDLLQFFEGGVGFESFSNLAYIGDLILMKTVLIQSYTKKPPQKKARTFNI